MQNRSKLVSLKYDTSWIATWRDTLILYSVNFYYKISNFLLEPWDTERTREKKNYRKNNAIEREDEI